MHSRSNSLTCLTLSTLEKLYHGSLSGIRKSQADRPLSFGWGLESCTGMLGLTFNIEAQYIAVFLHPLFSESARAIWLICSCLTNYWTEDLRSVRCNLDRIHTWIDGLHREPWQWQALAFLDVWHRKQFSSMKNHPHSKELKHFVELSTAYTCISVHRQSNSLLSFHLFLSLSLPTSNITILLKFSIHYLEQYDAFKN